MTDSIKQKDFKLPGVIYIALCIIYMEVLVKLFTHNTFFNIGLLFMPIFSFATSFIIYGFSFLFKEKNRRLFVGGCICLLLVLFATQTIYHRFFNRYLIVYSITGGGIGQVLSGDIARNTLSAVLISTPLVLALAVPTVITFIFYDKITVCKVPNKKWYIYLVPTVILHITALSVISLIPSTSVIHSGLFDPNHSIESFGVLYTEVLDIKYNILNFPQKLVIEDEDDSQLVQSSAYNISNFDFEKLYENEEDETLKTMHKYFSEKSPTHQNEYTGMYKGYNLITVVAEAFSPYAISEELTPTLYKMKTDGFDFTSFYTPIWGVSTSDGEYIVSTGLIPKSGVWSFYESSENYMPYCLGNMFRADGVKNVYAYHNNSYTYYRRDLSHTNIGYNYKALGNGVEKYVENVWPQSDLEMVSGSVSDYISSNERFHAYYMTVSGHLEYEKDKNAMASKNWEYVKDLKCSEQLKGYYACNIELDRAMEKLLSELEKAGVADKTVIMITPDHYPYGLEADIGDEYSVWREILGRDVETEFELYKSCLLLYCPSTKNAPTVEKPCYSADILPTLLNLFGFEYDSRLLMGSDILSQSEGLAVMSNHSFISELGRYNATTEEFIPNDENTFVSEEEKEEYIQDMNSRINNIFKISAKILETDYYGYVLRDNNAN
ncbi:MAG: sulfatase-like hydrolase/transferase [Clostridia bacterium]|nr:sulfatase-like hydrolase/transferase [Clostridia bacterium]